MLCTFRTSELSMYTKLYMYKFCLSFLSFVCPCVIEAIDRWKTYIAQHSHRTLVAAYPNTSSYDTSIVLCLYHFSCWLKDVVKL